MIVSGLAQPNTMRIKNADYAYTHSPAIDADGLGPIIYAVVTLITISMFSQYTYNKYIIYIFNFT